MESATERKSPLTDMAAVRSLDIVGFSPAYGLSHTDNRPKSQMTENDIRPTSTRVVKITVNNNTNKTPRYAHQKLLTRRLPERDDTQLKLGLSGSTAFLNTTQNTPRSRSGLARKNSEVSSLPSIVSKAGSEGHMSVTTYYDTDFGFHFDRLGPSVGMSVHKDPPSDAHDLEQELAHTANKHIYSLQIVSMANRGSKRTECVHSLLNTIWPPQTRSRPLVRDSSIKWPPVSRSRPLVRSNSHVWASPSQGKANVGKLHRFNPHEIGGLGPVKPPTTPETAISGRTVTPGPRK